MIRCVVFDIGNVVCAFDPEPRLRELARLTGLEPDRIHEAIWASGLEARAESGELSLEDFEHLVLDALEHRLDRVSLRTAWSTAFIPDPAVRELVTRLGRRSVAFTNNGPLFSECLAHELLDVERLFERVICSWQVRARKPEAAAFERLCAEVGLPAEELLFVDDDRRNTASARAAGLGAITFVSAEQLAADLGAVGVQPGW